MCSTLVVPVSCLFCSKGFGGLQQIIGTGKSVLLREIIKVLRKKYITATDAVAITASTGELTKILRVLSMMMIHYIIGIAACNIGGVTIHSFAGIGLGIESAEQLATKIKRNKKAMSRWLRTKALIIDEGRTLRNTSIYAPSYLSMQYLWLMVICLTR